MRQALLDHLSAAETAEAGAPEARAITPAVRIISRPTRLTFA